MALYAVSIWANKESIIEQAIVRLDGTLYKAFGALEAQSDEEAKEKALEEARAKWPQVDGYIDHRCVLFELKDGWFREGDN